MCKFLQKAFLVLFLASYGVLYAQKKLSVSGIALPFSSPETGFNIQGGIIGAFKTNRTDSVTRASNVYVFGMYSVLRQYRISTGCEIFTNANKYYIYSWIYHNYQPEAYFGVGQNVSPRQSEFIRYRVNFADIKILRKIIENVYAGAGLLAEQFDELRYPLGGIFDNNKPNGAEPYFYTGIGPVLRYDSRDNVISSKTGFYASLEYKYFQNFSTGNNSFHLYLLDIRKFIPLDKKQHFIQAFQAYFEAVSGPAPFRMLPNIHARAYNPNTFRDNSMYHLQSETRIKVWKRLGISVFGGISDYFFNVGESNFPNLKYNLGTGLRILMVKSYNLNMRIEYGLGVNTSNYYLSFYDAF